MPNTKYTGGIDGAGGFGVPADYGGQDTLGDPNDNVINAKGFDVSQLDDLMLQLRGTNNQEQQKLLEHANNLKSDYDNIQNTLKDLEAEQKPLRDEFMSLRSDVHRYYRSIIDMDEVLDDIIRKALNTWSDFASDRNPDGWYEWVDKQQDRIEKIASRYDIKGVYNATPDGGIMDDLGMISMEFSKHGGILGTSDPQGWISHMHSIQENSNAANLAMTAIKQKPDVWEPIAPKINGMSQMGELEEELQDVYTKLNKSRKQSLELGLKRRLLVTEMSKVFDDMEDALSQKRKTKSDERFLEGEQPESTIPNYRIAIDASPRVCGNCKFFNGSEGVEGNCSVYDSTVRANYICDAWQSQSLTPFHTPVRAIENVGTDDDVQMRAPLEKPESYVHESPGRVQGEYVGYIHNASDVVEYDGLYQGEDDKSAYEYEYKSFIPGDIVYSKAFRSMARVTSTLSNDVGNICGVDLIDGNGNTTGSGVTLADDLEPRSSKAIKRGMKTTLWTSTTASRALASDEAVQEMVDIVRSCYRSVTDIVDAYDDGELLSNQNALTPLRQDMLTVMSNPIFENVKTGRRRKYYRALQNALGAIGAARFILFTGYRTINNIKSRSGGADKQAMASVMEKAQSDAFDRVAKAQQILENALTLPSETHNDEAPGIGG